MSGIQNHSLDRAALPPVRALADQAFSRAAGAPLIDGNQVDLLKNAQENYPAWLAAIRRAQRHVHFESYIIHEDDTGREFAEALIAKSREGVPVRLIYDWMGGFGKTSRRFWNRLRGSGIEVRCYNRPRWDSPLGWLSRDHRKMLTVDSQVGFIAGLCVGQMWVGDPKKKLEGWRDTGIAVRGLAVAAIERAFAEVWAMLGSKVPAIDLVSQDALAPVGDVSLRVVATLPATAGLFRVDQLVAALARKRLWLTDAYYAGTTAYVQALKAAAMDGVDVRLLLPNGTDIPLLKPISRAGYRPLLEAGVRVFEWNGTMLHAKTAVADGHWARVGSSNLNLASWLGNCELDAVIENERFAREMEAMYLNDLENATEIVLDSKKKVCAPGEPRHRRSTTTSTGAGSVGRAAAGAIRLSNTIGAAFTNRRVIGPVEAQIMTLSGVLLLAFAILFAFFPEALVYPVIVMLAWMALALLYKGYRLHQQRRHDARR
ncbi:MAG: phospholipase D-like domain-containing protein [Bryobacteraceae bacterium]